MNELTVSLAYNSTDFGNRSATGAVLALPVKALDADGTVLAQGAAGVGVPVTFQLPESMECVFLRLTWPSGRTHTQRVDLAGRRHTKVSFNDHGISPNEWSAWAVPQLSPRSPLASGAANVDLGLQRFDNVWLRLWKHSERQWTLQKLEPTATYRNRAAWQFDVSLDRSCWLLQIGGSSVVWRFVSIPGGGPARILITPKDSQHPRADALKVIVTSFRSDAEVLLEFLARDALQAAGSLAHSAALASRVFADKFIDPISAVAGAYFLLRADQWQKIPRPWFENLSQHFDWLPDAALVHCVRLLREGSTAAGSERRPHELFKECLRRGWPIYTEGLALLQEAAAALRAECVLDTQEQIDQVQALGAAKTWAGAALSFYGRQPATPSALQWVGMPHAPRRKRLDPALSVGSRVELRGESIAEALAEESMDVRKLNVSKAFIKPKIPRRDDGEFLLGSIT